jgi:hypothetical protein
VITQVWYRGNTHTFILYATTDGIADDLRVADAIELQLKRNPGDADPPLAFLSIGGGITLRDQDTEMGYADVVTPVDMLTGSGTPAGVYYFDVCVILPGPIRRYVVKPTKVVVRDVVNQP